MTVRVLRLIEYTYDSAEKAIEDQGRWTLNRDFGPVRIRSAVLLPEFEPGTEEPRADDLHPDLVDHDNPYANAANQCVDCGGITFCGVAHGAGHDHSMRSVACTHRALKGVKP